MKKKYLSILVAGLLTVFTAGFAHATAISHTATDLTDVGTGDLWEYSYSVSDNTFAADTGFTIYFDLGLYDLLDPTPVAPNADWDVLTWNPDSGIPDDGAYDAYALVSGASLADAFIISFIWLGGAAGPGSQLFDTYDGLTFDILESGATAPAAVPEPSSLLLLGTGFIGLVRIIKKIKSRRNKMENLCRSALTLTIGLFILMAGTASAELVIDQNYQLISSARVGRTAFDYTYQVNIANDGSDVQNVIATVTSSSPNTTIIDGNLNFGDVLSGSTGQSTDTFTIRQNRRYPFSPSDLVWNVQHEQTSIEAEAGLSVINIPVGFSGNIAFTVNFETSSSNPYNIDFSQNLSPDNGGASLSTDFPPGWAHNTPGAISWVVNETITGISIGTYELTTNVTINETGESSQVKTIVTVVGDVAGIPALNPLGSSPAAIAPDEPTPVLFTTMLTGTNVLPVTVTLFSITDNGIIGELVDNGTSGDLSANDGIYSGSFTLLGSVGGGPLVFDVNASFPAGVDVTTDPYNVNITTLPIGIQASLEEANIAFDPDTGADVVVNQFVISVLPGTDDATIQTIAASVGGTVAGTIQGLDFITIQIPGNTIAELHTAMDLVSTNPVVLDVSPDIIGEVSAVTPTDTSFASQWGLTKIRADETWVVSRGNVTIAVLDTGADYNHPDLDSKIIKGRNYLVPSTDPNAFDPLDDNGHGTHVSGIAAAETNNAQGVAGVSWNSQVLAVKICNAAGSCSWTAMADGIKYAADQGAKIINLSLGGPSGSVALEAAVNYATTKGSLVIAAAGNNGNSVQNYPAAYANVLSVGNTTATDGRNGSSCFGAWVDLAAPGTSILSTMPTYNVTLNNAPYNISQNYASLTGTSMASPMTAGAAAVLWAKHPGWTPAQVRQRLIQTSKPLPVALQLGAGRIDLFEAVFNGSFEIGDLSEWTSVGTTSSIANLGPILPVDRNGHKARMGYVSTGPSGDSVSGSLVQSFTIEAGVTSIPIKMDFNFVTEEYPEWVGSIYDDKVFVKMRKPDGSVVTLATESVNGSAFIPVVGIDFPGGDNTVGMTGWKTISTIMHVTSGAGNYEIFVTDAGDDIYDSVILFDNLRFK